jgi:NAD(P)H dehydrogenase (quinone)
MKIGIIVHSKTGNTHSVALKLKEKLSTAGHQVNIEKVTPAGDAHPGVKNLQLETQPEVSAYDALVFGAPVWAFSLSPVLATYLTQLSSLRNKKIACFVTMGSPFSWMGGNRAIAKMKETCESKGATVLATGIISWSSKHREKDITKVVGNLGGLF